MMITPSSRRYRRVIAACTVAVLMLLHATVADAQSRPDTLPAAPLPTVRELVAKLPGTPASLGSLLRIAAREGIAGRIAEAQTRRADGALLRAARATDPVFDLTSGAASDLFGGSQRRALENSIVGTTGLMWGTDLSVSYVRQDGSGFDPVRQLAAPTTLTFSVSQPLLEGRNDRAAGWRAAMRERTASEFVQRRTWQQVATSIELLYWTLAESQSVEAVRQRSAELAERMLQRSTKLAALQLMPDADLLPVRAGIALRRAALLDARQARLERSDALIAAAYGERAGARLEGVVMVTTGDDELPDVAVLGMDSLASLLPLALAQRADVQAARERRDAAAVRASLARRALRPNVSVDAGWAAVANPTSLGAVGPAGTARGWRAGITVSAPLLNRDDRGRAIVAAADRDIEELRLEEAQNTVRLELRAAVRALGLARERLAAFEDASALAAQQLEAEQRRQQLGLGDTFRLLQTEDHAVQAQLEAVRARYDVLRAQARYRLATGTAGTGAVGDIP